MQALQARLQACSIASGSCTAGLAAAAVISPAPPRAQVRIISSVISTWHCMAKCLPMANAWFTQCAFSRTRVAPGGMLKVSPCQWKLSKDCSSPSHARATPLSHTRTSPQPISLYGLARTLPPNALDMSWPPRQCPSTGTSFRTASRINSRTCGIHGRSSFTLIAPPMRAIPEKSLGLRGTAALSSIGSRSHAIERRSR